MEEERDGEVLLLVTLGARGPCEASPFPSREQGHHCERGIGDGGETALCGTQSRECSSRRGSLCPPAHDLGRQRDRGRASSVHHPLLKVTGLDSAWMRAP